jgi:hypothetical protein
MNSWQKTLAIMGLWLSFFIFAGSVTSSSLTYAAGEIGTHLGEGDPTAQAMIMDFLGSRVRDDSKAGFPVTIQVYVDNTNQGTLQSLAAAARRNGFFPIVRVDHVCKPAGPANATQFVGWIREAFGDDVVIAWGNEVNNEAVECPTPENFWAGLSQVKNRVGPSALDFYNPIFPAELFVAGGNKFGGYNGFKHYFANAYGCIGTDKDGCNPVVTDTQNIGFELPKSLGSYYMTEFSLSPGDGSENNNAPDTDLRKVVEFIESRAAETGAQKITPLIRNVCGAGSRWLIYVSETVSRTGESEVYTADGTKIDIDTCSAAQTEGDYFLYPIPGLYEIDKALRTREHIIAGLANQGYQAQCLSPEIRIDALIDSLPGYLYNDPIIGAKDTLQAGLTQNTDFSSSKIPAWRLDGDHEIQLVNSLETLFGYIDPGTEKDNNKIKSGFEGAPIYRQLSLHQQCVYQSRILDTNRNMCNKLANPGPDSCPLNKQIQGSNYDILSLQAAMEKRIQPLIGQFSSEPNPRESARNQVCRELVETTKPTDPIRVALHNTPLYISNAYRLGFLVLSAELVGKPTGLDDEKPFRFMRPSTEPERQVEPHHEIRIFAFRIPDIGMNRDPNSDIYYKDPIELTRDRYLTEKEQLSNAERYDQARFTKNTYSDPDRMDVPIRCEGKEIYCAGGIPENPVTLAFAQFVNDYLRSPSNIKNPDVESITNPANQSNPDLSYCRLDPEEIPYQDISRIFSSGKIYDTEGRVFVDGQDIYENLQDNWVSQSYPIEFSEDKEVPEGESLLDWPFNFDQEAKIRSDTPGQAGSTRETMKLHAYLIIPQGFQLGVTEEVLAGRFMDAVTKEQFFAAFDKDADDSNPFGKLIQYFSISGVAQSVSTFAQTTRRIVDTVNPVGCVDPSLITPGSPQEPCTVYNLMIRNQSEQNDHAPRIHGGILGEVILVMQKYANHNDKLAWRYINSCKTIEQYILGTCEGLDAEGGGIKDDDKTDKDSLAAVAKCDGGARMTTGEKAIHMYSRASLNDGNSCTAFVNGANYTSYAAFKEIEDLKTRGLGTALGLQQLESELASRFQQENFHLVERWRDPTDLPTGNAQQYCQNLYSYVACVYPDTLIQNTVNEEGKWDTNGSETACEYVVRKAQSAGVSPRFALAMWGEESGFSHYRDAFAFGITVGTTEAKTHVGQQLQMFLNTINNEKYNNPEEVIRGGVPRSLEGQGPTGVNSYHNFLERYANEVEGSNQFCNNPNFPARLKQFHYFLGRESR